jgi:hypothetical protein
VFTLGYLCSGTPNELAPFALWVAFPPSDYYEASDATADLGRLLSLPFGGGLPRSQRWTPRGSEGGGYLPDPIRALRNPERQQGRTGGLLKPMSGW